MHSKCVLVCVCVRECPSFFSQWYYSICTTCHTAYDMSQDMHCTFGICTLCSEHNTTLKTCCTSHLLRKNRKKEWMNEWKKKKTDEHSGVPQTGQFTMYRSLCFALLAHSAIQQITFRWRVYWNPEFSFCTFVEFVKCNFSCVSLCVCDVALKCAVIGMR